MQGRPTEIRALEKKVMAIQSKLKMLSEEMKDLPKGLNAVEAEIKILKKNQSKKWLTGKEVMVFLGISARTLQYMRCSGELPFTRFYNNLLYLKADLDIILETNYCKNHPNKEP